MTDESTFPDLLRRVRLRDEEAAAELVRLYEPVVHCFVHIRLRDARIRRVLDSTDVCQSVFKSFFDRAARGHYDLSSPAQLRGLLLKMATHKLADAARRKRLATDATPVDELDVCAPAESVVEPLAARDAVDKVRLLLPEKARQIADLRADGLEWSEVAGRLGGSAQALRKVFERALDRVRRALGTEEREP